MKGIFWAVFVIMFGFTLIGLNEGFARFFFANGSDGLMRLISTSFSIRLAFLFIYALIFFFANRWGNKKVYYSMLLLLAFVWFLSGRMIGLFPDGRLISGWFYIKTETIDLCKTSDDCEKTLYYKIKYEKNFLGFYSIKNGNERFKVFVGPLITTKVDDFFSKEFHGSNQ